MSFSLVIDDMSLVLLLSLVTALSISIYISRSYQPLIHPLILSRQADVSQVRQPKESAIYRNANSPSGFDLALRPRKEINDVADLIKHATPSGANRTVYGRTKSNADVAGDATAFATGFLKLSCAPVLQTAFAIAADTDSYESIIALLANSHTSASSRFHTVVLPPTASSPTVLPSAVAHAGARSIIGLYTNAKSVSNAFHLAFLDPSALIVVPTSDLDQVNQQANVHFGSSHRLRIYGFDHVVEMGSRGSLLSSDVSARDSIHQIQSHFWNVHANDWVAVQHTNLIAGVTAQLAMFPADKIPTATDHLFVEASDSSDPPSSVVMATRSPAGFALALTALFTGASITAGKITPSYDDPTPSVTDVFTGCQPSLIYSSAQGASSLACALTCLTRSSPLASFAARSKLFTLRNGSFSRQGLADRLVYSKARSATGCQRIRNLLVLGAGDTVAQALLDSLRSHLGCAVVNAYLPSLSSSAALTSPISATHAFDLQAFAEHEHGAMQVPAHVGPPSVAVELKLIQTPGSAANDLTITGTKPDGYQGDPMGEIVVQGYLVAGTDGDWVPTGDFGAIRSNGTLVVLRGAQESDPVPVPTLSSRKPVLRQRRAKTGTKGLAAAALVASLFLATLPAVSAGRLQKRASINSTMTNVAKMGMLTGQRASWEQGVGQSALLELDYPTYSVFTSSSGGPAFRPGHERSPSNPPTSVLSMAYHAASRQDSLGRLAFKITGDESRNAGSSLDGASAGPEVLLNAWIAGQINQQTGEENSGFYIEAAQRTLNLVLNETPRDRNGAISHRYTEVALWSDAMYMMPPFLAYYGMLTRNQTLMQTAYDQIRLYRNEMRLPTGLGNGLWGHILLGNGTWTDAGPWCTGNGWVSAGMLRVLATIEQSESSLDMIDQKQDLVTWVNEILDAAYPLLDDRALLWHNYMNDTSDFFDSAGSALLAYSTYRLASMVPGNDKWVSQADQIYRSLATSLDTIGQFRTGYPVTDVLAFTHQGETSSESLSFLMLMTAAKRDYMNNDVVQVSSSESASNAAPPQPLHHITLPTLLIATVATILSLF